MATWASSLDVLRDLDRLSEFSAGSPSTQNFEIVSTSSYGRGSVKNYEIPRPASPVRRKEEDHNFPRLPTFKPGIGRGERMMAISQHRKDQSLQRQLRMTMGPGYSNELIEGFIRGESSSDHSSEPEQFEDYENTSESQLVSSDDKKESNPTSSSPFKEPNFETTDTPKLLDTVEERSSTPVQTLTPRRCRNALLNNLPNYKKDLETTLTQSIGHSDHVDSSSRRIDYVFARALNRDDEFQFREEDFPPL